MSKVFFERSTSVFPLCEVLFLALLGALVGMERGDWSYSGINIIFLKIGNPAIENWDYRSSRGNAKQQVGGEVQDEP